MDQSTVVGLFTLAGAALGAGSGFVGLLVRDYLKSKKEKSDFLISKLEEVSKKIEKIFIDEISNISVEIRNFINGSYPADFNKEEMHKINPRFKYQAAAIINLYFRDTCLEEPYNEFIKSYVELINKIRVDAFKKCVTYNFKLLPDIERAEIEEALTLNNNLCDQGVANIQEAIFVLGKKLMNERGASFSSWFKCC